MNDELEGKDGVERMFARFKIEIAAIKKVLKEQENSHSQYTNFFVESCRHGPYLVGHLLAWGTPVIAVLLIGGWVL